MRTTEVKVYSFAELPFEAKQRAHRKWLSHGFVNGYVGYEYAWAGEARDTMEAFEREFGIRLANWHYDSSGYDIRFDGISDEVLALSGNRARAWIWNNHGDILLSPTVRHFTKIDGKRVEAVSATSRRFKSKVFFDRVYDGTCPWTGYCLDCDALDPLAYFAFGVEWSDKEKKRVAGNRKLSIDNATTIEDLLRDCADSLFRSLQRDCEYNESMEAFAERCAANDYEFTEDGELWTGAKEIAA